MIKIVLTSVPRVKGGGEKTPQNNLGLVLGDLDHTHIIFDLDLGNLHLSH